MHLRSVLFVIPLVACVSESRVDWVPPPHFLSENLIGNPSLEGGASGWSFLADDGVDGTGSLSAEDGVPFLQTDVLNGSGAGDARWWFDPVPLEAGKFYEYADTFRAYGTGRLVWLCRSAEGRHSDASWQTQTTHDWATETFRFYVSDDCLGTVMHLLDRPGYLQTSRHTLREVAPAPFARAMVSIAFDDGNESNVTVAAPELERRGWRGSFYLILDRLDAEGYLTSAQVEELVEKGHEIGSHSASHPRLVDVSTSQLRDEIEGSLLQLRKRGARGGFAYPFGEFDEVVEHYVGSRARYVRTSLHGLNDATLDVRRIRIYPVTTDTTNEDLERVVADVVRTRTWLVLLFHDLGVPDAEEPYRTDVAQFVGLLDSLGRSGAEVLPVLDVLEAIGK